MFSIRSRKTLLMLPMLFDLDRPQRGAHELARDVLPKRFQDRVSRNVGQQGGRPEQNLAHERRQRPPTAIHTKAPPQVSDPAMAISHEAVHRVERDEARPPRWRRTR